VDSRVRLQARKDLLACRGRDFVHRVDGRDNLFIVELHFLCEDVLHQGLFFSEKKKKLARGGRHREGKKKKKTCCHLGASSGQCKALNLACSE